jgi:hypothetical protein
MSTNISKFHALTRAKLNTQLEEAYRKLEAAKIYNSINPAILLQKERFIHTITAYIASAEKIINNQYPEQEETLSVSDEIHPDFYASTAARHSTDSNTKEAARAYSISQLKIDSPELF